MKPITLKTLALLPMLALGFHAEAIQHELEKRLVVFVDQSGAGVLAVLFHDTPHQLPVFVLVCHLRLILAMRANNKDIYKNPYTGRANQNNPLWNRFPAFCMEMAW